MLDVSFHVCLSHLNSIDLDGSAKVGPRSLYLAHLLSSPVLECDEDNEYYVFSYLSTNEWGMCSFVNDRLLENEGYIVSK